MRPERLLAAAGIAAIATFRLASGDGLPWPAVVVGAAVLLGASARVRLPALPGFVLSALRLLALAACAGAALVTVLSRQVPIIPEAPGREWATILGFTLAGLVTLGLFAPRDLGRPRFLVPTTVALLVAAGLGHSRPEFVASTALSRVPPRFLLPATAAAVLLWAWAVAAGGPRPTRRALASFFGAAAGLAAFLVVFLPLAQPHVERAVARAIAGDATGLSEGSSLGDVASLAQSDRVVLRAWTREPGLLRGYVHDRFDGRQWSTSPGPRSALRPLDGPPPVLAGAAGRFFLLPGREAAEAFAPAAIETRVVPAVRDGLPLVVPAGAVIVRAPVPWIEWRAPGALATAEVPALYGVASRRAAGGDPDGPRTLALPAVDPRVRALAASLAAGARDDREKLARTLGHLRAGYRYTLAPGPFRTSDPLAEFLFDKRAAYCEYFATAAAVLLRLQGVPARYVKGFAVGPQTEAGDHHVVRDRDAHAWIEAWIPGEGWVEADPTPPADFAAVHPRRRLAALAEWVEGLKAAAAQLWALASSGAWRELAARTLASAGRALERLLTARAAAALLLAAAVAGAVVGWRRLRRGAAARPTAEAAAPAELRRLLARLESSGRGPARRGRPRAAWPSTCVACRRRRPRRSSTRAGRPSRSTTRPRSRAGRPTQRGSRPSTAAWPTRSARPG
ncbi:MAG: transglutaminaseTgpA domain-containing protein [Vicinamibacteria bacterium]